MGPGTVAVSSPEPQVTTWTARFVARATRYTDPSALGALDELAAWVRTTYAQDLEARPSRHLYVSMLPPDAVRCIDVVRQHPLVTDSVRQAFAWPVEITPLPETDELYLSHYNKDRGGDHGLFARHYDGNLRFVPIGHVVRALIYVRSSGDYEVVFGDSGLRRRFVTYDLGLLDFHRELHWVEGSWEAREGDRVVLKCNYLVVPADRRGWIAPLKAINLGQFYVVKAAMEYSKSPRTLPQRVVGLICNVVRALNNVHPLLPHLGFLALATLPLVGLVALALG